MLSEWLLVLALMPTAAGSPQLPATPPDLPAASPSLPEGFECRYLLDAIPQAPDLLPARLLHGSAPPLPAMMVSSGEALLEVTVDLDGRVAGIRPLRSTPALADLVSAVVRDWRFGPAQRRFTAVADTLRFTLATPRISTVLVVAIFRPPSLAAPTLGQAPADLAAAPDETPIPLTLATPRFPLRAFTAGVVLLELSVDREGCVDDVRVVESAPPFDAEALDAVRRWRFSPARIDGRPVPAFVYAVLGFPLPTTASDEPRR